MGRCPSPGLALLCCDSSPDGSSSHFGLDCPAGSLKAMAQAGCGSLPSPSFCGYLLTIHCTPVVLPPWEQTPNGLGLMLYRKATSPAHLSVRGKPLGVSMSEGLPTGALLLTLPPCAPPVRSQVSRGRCPADRLGLCSLDLGLRTAPGLTFLSFAAFPSVIYLPLSCLKHLLLCFLLILTMPFSQLWLKWVILCLCLFSRCDEIP